MEEERKKTIADAIWDFLASVRLAIIIFAFIAITSIAGTILDQKGDHAKNLEILSTIFGESLAPTLFWVADSLGFTDMYDSWWFTGLLLLFSVNLIICSVDRLPRIWKLVNESMVPMPEEKLRKFPVHREITVRGNPDEVKDEVAAALRKMRFSAKEMKDENGRSFCAQRGKYSRLGVIVTHFSILFILMGALIGMRFGYKAYLNLPEGALSGSVFSANGHEVPLGFQIRCDNFKVDYYDKSDMPKEYRSWLTIFENGKEVVRKSITVNAPLKYKGITFYQSSYGMVPRDLDKGIFVLNAVSHDRRGIVNLRLGESFHISENLSARIVDFSPALRFDQSGHSFTYANQMSNPAAFIQFSEKGKNTFSGWVLARHPQTWQLPDGSRVEFLDYWGVEYTGLQVRKDPGVWVVYFGCIAMSVGLFMVFFMSHRKLWIRLVDERNATRVVIGGTANKNRASLERGADKILSIMRKRDSGGK